MKNKKISKRRGITLIEMMVVIAIISVIMTIIYVNVGNVGTGATDQLAIKSSRVKIEAALFGYYSDYRSYPSTDEGLDILVNPPALEDGRVPRSFLQSTDIEDPWKTPYLYENIDGKYRIYSLGADKQPGGEGDNADFDLTEN